jgi:hypothetical protein
VLGGNNIKTPSALMGDQIAFIGNEIYTGLYNNIIDDNGGKEIGKTLTSKSMINISIIIM